MNYLIDKALADWEKEEQYELLMSLYPGLE